MGSIITSPAFNPEISMEPMASSFRNATSNAELQSLLTEVQNALEDARNVYQAASNAYNAAVAEREVYLTNGIKNASLVSSNIVNDYNSLYLGLYRPWYDTGKAEGNSQMNSLINEIVINRKYRQSSWGNAKVSGASAYLKKNLYNRVYKPGSERYRYWFQQNEVVIPFIQSLISAYDSYVKESKRLNDNVIQKKKELDTAQSAVTAQQELYTKTATELERAKNLPEMTQIAANAAAASDKIKADSNVEMAKIQADFELKKSRNRIIIAGGVIFLALAAGAFFYFKK